MAIDNIYLEGLRKLLDEGCFIRIGNTTSHELIIIISRINDGKEELVDYIIGENIISLLIKASNEVVDETNGKGINGPSINLDDVIKDGYYLYISKLSENEIYSAIFRKESDRLTVKQSITTADIVSGLEELSKSFIGFDNGKPQFTRKFMGKKFHLAGLKKYLRDNCFIDIYEQDGMPTIVVNNAMPTIDRYFKNDNQVTIPEALHVGGNVLSLLVHASNKNIDELSRIPGHVQFPTISLDELIKKGYTIHFTACFEDVYVSVHPNEGGIENLVQRVTADDMVSSIIELDNTFQGFDDKNQPQFIKRENISESKTYSMKRTSPKL